MAHQARSVSLAKISDQQLSIINNYTCIESINLFSQVNRTILTLSKTFGPVTTYFLGGVPIKVVDNFKLLGIVFSSSLSFSSHVDVVCRKVSRLTGFVIRISRHMHFRALLYLFKALITPHLTYCAVVWKPCQTDLLDRLDKCQRKISKVLMYRNKSCSSDLSYELRLSAFGLIKTCDLLDLLRLIFCFKLINGFGPSSFLQYFNPSKVNELRYLHSTSHTNSFFNSVFVSFPRLWNELPSSVRSATSLSVFKYSCKKHFLT